MYEFLIAIFALAVILGPAIFSVIKSEKEEEMRRAARLREQIENATPENEDRGVSLAGYMPPERLNGAGVYGILLAAFRSLSNQRASGFRNWISTCIEKLQRGEEVKPETALLALRWTRDELSGMNGRRYDLKELGRAILALEVETGEWG